MRTCTEKRRPAVPVSSREAAERATALTKEENVIWQSERSFSIIDRKDSEAGIRESANGDRDASED